MFKVQGPAGPGKIDLAAVTALIVSKMNGHYMRLLYPVATCAREPHQCFIIL